MQCSVLTMVESERLEGGRIYGNGIWSSITGSNSCIDDCIMGFVS